MCLDNRQYTPAAVEQLQTIALVCELRRRAKALQSRNERDSSLADGLHVGMELLLNWLDELAPTNSRCDNPPPESLTLADYTAGMVE